MNIINGYYIKPEFRQMIVDDIKIHVKRTGMTLKKILKLYNIAQSTYYSWFKADGHIKTERKKRAKSLFSILPEEIDLVKKFRDNHWDVGYKKLTEMMIDVNIAFLSRSSVYRALKSLNMLHKNNVVTFAENEFRKKPEYVHHYWHTDLAYIRIGQIFYYLIMVLDGYSRFLLNWSLLSDMTEFSVSLFIHETKEKYPHCEPMLIMDNGSQFISKDFKKMLSEINIRPVHTRRNHPQTNGKIERMNGLVKSEAIRKKYPQKYSEAIAVLEEYQYEYNYARLHSGIQYLRPADMFFNRGEIILEERKNKILLAKEIRMQKNRLQLEFVS